MPASVALISSILEDLGHEVPDEETLEEILQRASDKVKLKEGLDPKQFEYKLVPVETKWMKDYLEFVSRGE